MRKEFIVDNSEYTPQFGALYRYTAQEIEVYWQTLDMRKFVILPNGAILLYLGTDVPGNFYKYPCFFHNSEIYITYSEQTFANLSRVE
jgi:hypothetical protein